MNAAKLSVRLAAFGAAFLLLLFFSNDFGLIDIQKTSIVTAVALDAGEEGVDVTVQIAVPKSGATTAGNVTVKNAPTMVDAIAELNLKTGWYPTLVHCRLILLGEEAAKTDVFRNIDYFLRSQFVEDTCLVAVCRGSAEKALTAQSPVGDMTYAAIEKVLSSEAQQTGLVSVNILRDFAKGYYGAAESGFLPLLTVREDAEGGATTSSGASESASSGSPSDGKAVFDASETALFVRGKQVETLNAEETLAFNLADTDTDFAYGNVTVAEKGEPVIYSLRMKITKKLISVRAEGDLPVLHFTVILLPLLTAAFTTLSARAGLFRSALPSPFFTILGTGQPMFISISANLSIISCSHAAFIKYGSFPKIWAQETFSYFVEYKRSFVFSLS